MHVCYCARFKVVLAVVFSATSLVPKLCSSSLLTCRIRWHKGNYLIETNLLNVVLLRTSGRKSFKIA